MVEYYPGHVKREPQSGAIALRTTHPEPVAGQEIPLGGHPTWMVMSMFSGPMNMRTEMVEAWDDIYVAGPPSE